jgi:ABC-type transport system substrate-binding protein
LAFAHATDREALARVGGLHMLPALGGFISPPIPGHSPQIGLPYDPERARRLLAEGGFPDGRGLGPFTVLVPRVGEDAFYEALTDNWREILGVEVNVAVTDLGYLTEILTNPPLLGRLGWLADYPDPDNFLRVHLHSASGHPSRWKNATFDALVEEAQASTDHRRRMALYHEADRLLVTEEAAVIPLVYTRTMTLVQPHVKGWWSTFLSVSPIADLFVEHQGAGG